MEKIKNPKIIYLIAVMIILLGMVVTGIWKTNFSLDYKEYTRIDVYLGKDYNLEDMKQIAKEVFPKEKIRYQEIETFHDSLSVHVSSLTEEQLATFKEKVKEKYELEETDNSIVTTTIPHYRIRDMVKPYIIPMIIATILIFVYVGIRYLNLGVYKVIGVLLLRIVVSEAVLASVIEITRIPVGIYTMPVGIVVYILVTVLTVVGYEKQISKKKEEEKKK